MLQRTFTALVVSVLALAFPSAAAAQMSLTLPSEIFGSPGQYPSATGTLTLGAPGAYFFKYQKVGTLTTNLQIGSVAGSVPDIAPNKSFFYAKPVPFYLGAWIPGNTCASPLDAVLITFYKSNGDVVLKKDVAIRCFEAKAVFSIKNVTDPLALCGAGKPLLIDGSKSATASTYVITMTQGNTPPVIKTLTPPEVQNIANFDLRTIAPPGYFEGGKTYTVSLRTVPAHAETKKTISFTPAKPAFSMTDRTGKVWQAMPSGTGGPVTVCPGSMIMNAAATSCESKYLLMVQESDANGNPTQAYGWERRFAGIEAQNGMNLSALITAHPDGLKPANKPFALAPTGGIKNAKPRYFRIGLATEEPSPDARWLLVRTGLAKECAQGPALPTPCPRTDDILWFDVKDELARLYRAPCEIAPACGEAERQFVPKPLKEYAWQGPLPGDPAVVNIAAQDQIVAAIRAYVTAKPPPLCSDGKSKVPVDIEVFIDAAPGSPGHYRIAVGVWYACCEN